MFSAPAPLVTQAEAFQSGPVGEDAYRFSLQSVRSWGDQELESPEVRCLFASFAAFVGAAPDNAGGAETAWLFGAVLQQAGNNFVRGGMNNVTRAMAAFLTAHGGEVRTSAGVARIEVVNGRATGVRLESGEVIATAGPIISATDPRQLVERLLGPEVAGPAITEGIRRYEWGDATMAIFAALDGPVAYAAGPEPGMAAHVHLTGPELASISQSFVETRGGKLPATPVVVAWNDTAIDPSRAPAGTQLKKFVVLGVPSVITGDASGRVDARDWDQAKDSYADYLLEMIDAHYLPGLRQRLIRRVVHSPRDLERTLSSAVHGTILHGAMTPYQMGSQRPIPELGEYRTPVLNV